MSVELKDVMEKLEELNGQIVLKSELESTLKDVKEELKGAVQTDEVKNLISKVEGFSTELAEMKHVPQSPVSNNESEEIKNASYEKYLRKGDKVLSEAEVKTMIAANDTTGGYLASTQMMSEIIRNEVEMDPMLMIADVQNTTERDSVFIKVNDLTGAVHVLEAEDSTEEDFSFEEVRVPNHELAKTVVVSRTNIQDANFPLVNEIAFQLGQAFGITSNADFITGNGVNKAKGFLEDANIEVMETAASGALGYEDVVRLFGKLKKSYKPNASWIADRAILTEIMLLEDSAGRPIYTKEPLSNFPQSVGTLHGRPVYEATSMADTVTAGNKILAVGDFRQGYFVSNRQNVEIFRDDFTGANKRVVKFHGSKRVGGQVKKAEAIKVLKVKA